MMKIKSPRIICLLLCFVCLFTVTASAADDLSYDGYNYDAYGVSTPAPEGYEPTAQIRGEELPCGAFSAPEDIFYAEDGNVYIADTGNNRIVVLDSEFAFVKTVDTVTIDGVAEVMEKPCGIFVTKGNMYIVQSDKQRVLRTDMEGNVLSRFLRPVSDIFSDEMTYTPIKVLVNNSGTVYVLVKNFVYGALTYSPEGNFLNFYGSNKVKATLEVLLDYFWKQVMSKEQIDQMKRYVPTEYANFCIDDENFIYTVTKGSKTDQVRRLNTLGTNVLSVYERNISGHTGRFGDLESQKMDGIWTSNSFVDVAVDTDGFINILDQENGRIFQFDPESRLLHISGGRSDSGYGFNKASAIETVGEKIAVIDSVKNTLTVFTATEYGNLVRNAVKLYNDGHYTDAATAWEEITVRNRNFELAYDGLGKAAYEKGEYSKAMSYFKLAYSREGYSDAFKELRADFLRDALPYIGTAIVILVAAWFIFRKKLKPKHKLSDFTTMQVLTSPADTLFEIKYHGRFNGKVVPVVLLFMFLSIICTRQLTAFTFNYNNVEEGNMLVVLAVMLLVFVAFCTVNWCITSLLDGKGRFKEIACTTAYALIPYIACSYISCALSYFITVEESMFLTIISAVGFIWSAALILMGFKSIHEYSMTKTVLSILITLLGVVIVIFLCVLLIGLIQQIISFFATIYNEIMYR